MVILVETIKTVEPTKLSSRLPTADQDGALIRLTAAEAGKLWATYMGNSMAVRVLSYMTAKCQDQQIKEVVDMALGLSERFVATVKGILEKEEFPVPVGFTEADVRVDAPRLFEDEFYLHYLKYTGKAGLSLYAIALPIMTRPDIRSFFGDVARSTVQLIEKVSMVMNAKGMMTKPPVIPYPPKVDFVKKQSYFNGFFGDVRPLQALEITHLFDNIENNATSKAVLIGFGQTAESQQVRDFFARGKELAHRHFEIFSHLLHKEDLPSPSGMESLVTQSTFAPFSDKLMLFHKLDMFAMRIRSYGNSLAVCARHDIAAKYARLLVEVGNYTEDGANIMIDNGWMEQPPEAMNRDAMIVRS